MGRIRVSFGCSRGVGRRSERNRIAALPVRAAGRPRGRARHDRRPESASRLPLGPHEPQSARAADLVSLLRDVAKRSLRLTRLGQEGSHAAVAAAADGILGDARAGGKAPHAHLAGGRLSLAAEDRRGRASAGFELGERLHVGVEAAHPLEVAQGGDVPGDANRHGDWRRHDVGGIDAQGAASSLAVGPVSKRGRRLRHEVVALVGLPADLDGLDARQRLLAQGEDASVALERSRSEQGVRGADVG